MDRKYLIFVPEICSPEYSEIIDWGFQNLNSPNVLVLTENEIYYIQYETPIFDIINKENNSMIELGEDDWIDSQESMSKIYSQIKAFVLNLKENYLIEKLKRIISLFEIALNQHKNIYFFL